MIPVFLFIVIILMVVIRYETSKSSKSQKELSDAFWEREAKASIARKKDISNLDFIIFPSFLSSNSDIQDEEIIEVEKKLKELSEKKIVNFNGMTNTDLRLEYGAANFPFLSEYDNNFMILIRTLNKYGKLLLSYDVNRAEEVLAFAIESGSDIAETYKLLAGIYKDSDRTDKISELIAKADNLKSLTKDKLVSDLNDMLPESETE